VVVPNGELGKPTLCFEEKDAKRGEGKQKARAGEGDGLQRRNGTLPKPRGQKVLLERKHAD